MGSAAVAAARAVTATVVHPAGAAAVSVAVADVVEADAEAGGADESHFQLSDATSIAYENSHAKALRV